MKTEREFIDSVYKKYETAKSEQQRRINLYKTMSLCAAAACICLVTFVGIRTIPYLNAAKESVAYDVANGEAIVYSVKMDAEEDLFMADTEGETEAASYKYAQTEMAAEAHDMTAAAMDQVVPTEAVPEQTKAASHNVFSFNMTTPEASKLIMNSVNYTVSLAEDVACDVYYTDFPEMEIIDTDIAKENAEVSYGSCKISGENKYYINIKNNTALVLINQNDYTQDEFYMIANSIEY